MFKSSFVNLGHTSSETVTTVMYWKDLIFFSLRLGGKASAAVHNLPESNHIQQQKKNDL